jgi:hypothetical protein
LLRWSGRPGESLDLSEHDILNKKSLNGGKVTVAVLDAKMLEQNPKLQQITCPGVWRDPKVEEDLQYIALEANMLRSQETAQFVDLFHVENRSGMCGSASVPEAHGGFKEVPGPPEGCRSAAESRQDESYV